MRHRDVGAGIEHLGDQADRFDELAQDRLRHLAEPVMPHRYQLALGVGGELQLLYGARAIAVGGEHLRAGQHQLHRLSHHFRRHRRQRCGRPGVALATEPTADEGAHHPHLLRVDAEQPGERLLRAGNALRRRPHRQLVALPAGDRSVWLHRVVVLYRCDVGRIQFHGAAVERSCRIAAIGVRRTLAVAEMLRHIGLAEHGIHRGDLLGPMVVHPHPRRRRESAIQRVGDDHGDVLSIIENGVVLQQRCVDRLGRVLLIGEFRCIIRRDDGQHAGHALRLRQVEAGDAARSDGALHQHRMHQAGQGELRGVARGACHLQTSVHAIERCAMLAMMGSPQAATVCNARNTVRRSKVSLKPFWLAGLAPCPACAAASRNV